MDRKTEVVADYLSTSVPVARPHDTVEEVLAELRGHKFDAITSVYVLDDDGRLSGVASFVDVLAASPDTTLNALMTSSLPAVPPDLDREKAASIAIREEVARLPVVDTNQRFLGEFPARAIMRVLRQEHLEDLHHMAGILQHTEEARNALQAPPLERVRYRLPWLIVGLLGSMVATVLVAEFEETLKAQIAVAFFIPGIVYLADAVGTQSEAVAVRGLSLTRAGIGHLLIGELSTGILIGLVLALLSGLFVVAVFGQIALAIAVAVSLIGACTIATSIGLFLPWLFSRAGWDPALGSGPIATIIQDVLSLLIYFGAVSAIA